MYHNKTIRSSLMISLGLMMAGALHADPNIPAECATPGSCPELTPALKSMTLREGVSLADTGAAHTATIKAPETLDENVALTLPPRNGQPGEVLIQDNTAKLSWKKMPIEDHAKSGWMDIGNMRIEWGTIRKRHGDNLTHYTYTFPQPFKEKTTVSLTLSITDNPGGKMMVTIGGASNKAFAYWTDCISGGITGNSTVHWQAIGLKP